MQYKTHGIIIKRKNFGEADRLLTIYTQKRGKVKAIAKGVRRIKSKLAGHLELFYLTDFVIAEGKNIDIITGAVNIRNFCHLRDNLTCSNQAYYIAEIIDKLVHEHEKNINIFCLLSDSMLKINENNKVLLSYFTIQILKLLGHLPELNLCTHCHEKLLCENKNYFSNRFGGVICNKCYKYDQFSKQISTNQIKVLRLLINNKIQIIHKIKYDKKLMSLVLQFLEYVTEMEIKSKKFL